MKNVKKIKPMSVKKLYKRWHRHLIEIMCDVVEFEVSNGNEDYCKDITIDGKVYRSLIVTEDDYDEDINEEGKISGFPVDDLLNRRIDKIMNKQGDSVYAFPSEAACLRFMGENLI